MNPWLRALPALIIGPCTYLIIVWILKRRTRHERRTQMQIA